MTDLSDEAIEGELDEVEPAERLVKSVERVRDLGEVFTPSKTVNEMLDLIPAPMWAVHPSPTFLEPACGDGNFLVAILERKLEAVRQASLSKSLPAGASAEGAIFHGLEALSSIYAVDISPDNVIGGTPGHEIGARTRLLRQFWSWVETATGVVLDDRHHAAQVAEWIISHNVLIGNMLPSGPDGKPSGRDELPIVEYSWEPVTLEVSTTRTTLGRVMSAVPEDGFDLWGGPEAHWQGSHVDLHKAERLGDSFKTSLAKTSGGN